MPNPRTVPQRIFPCDINDADGLVVVMPPRAHDPVQFSVGKVADIDSQTVVFLDRKMVAALVRFLTAQ